MLFSKGQRQVSIFFQLTKLLNIDDMKDNTLCLRGLREAPHICGLPGPLTVRRTLAFGTL
jgi:hypothetical protein